jgi:hypothetical protein
VPAAAVIPAPGVSVVNVAVKVSVVCGLVKGMRARCLSECARGLPVGGTG